MNADKLSKLVFYHKLYNLLTATAFNCLFGCIYCAFTILVFLVFQVHLNADNPGFMSWNFWCVVRSDRSAALFRWYETSPSDRVMRPRGVWARRQGHNVSWCGVEAIALMWSLSIRQGNPSCYKCHVDIDVADMTVTVTFPRSFSA